MHKSFYFLYFFSVDIKKSATAAKSKSVKRRSNNDNLSKPEESNSSNSLPAKRTRRSQVDLTDPLYLEPFKYGWVREVVYRAVKEIKTSANKADTYYFTPEGKKIRTRKEILEIRTFSFCLKKLYLYFFLIS